MILLTQSVQESITEQKNLNQSTELQVSRSGFSFHSINLCDLGQVTGETVNSRHPLSAPQVRGNEHQSIIIPILMRTLNPSHYYLHFEGEEIESQKGYITCPRSPSQVKGLNLNPYNWMLECFLSSTATPTLPCDFMNDLTCRCDLRRQWGGYIHTYIHVYMISGRYQITKKSESGVLFLPIFKKNPQYIYSQFKLL